MHETSTGPSIKDVRTFLVCPGQWNYIFRTPLRRPRPILSKPTPDEQEVKFTDSKGNIRVGIITGTSVSSSVSTSTSENDQIDQERLLSGLNPAELLKHRLKLYSQRRRYY